MHATLPDETLRRADLERDASTQGRAGAVETYCRFAEHIDPSCDEGAARVRWILDLGRSLPFELEPLMRRASDGAADASLRGSARLALAHFAVCRSEFERAESTLRGVLQEVRGTGSRLEHAACLHLASAFRAQHREFEALVMARRSVALAKLRAGPADVATTLIHLGACLTEIGEWSAFDAVAAEIEAIVPSIPPVRRDVVVSSLRRYRIGSLLDRGDLVGARRELDAYDVSDGDAWLREPTARGAILLSIRCDLAAGNVEGALSTTQGLLASTVEGSAEWIAASSLHVQGLARAAPGRAPGVASHVLGVLGSRGTPAVGTGGVLRAAAAIGGALEPVPGAGHEALAAYEIAAAAMFERTAELHACLGEIEELSAAIGEDREMLARFRRRYLDEHGAMLATIARLHDAGVVAEPLRLARLVASDGAVHVCAWCLSVRTGDGTYLPIGQFLPESRRFGVTHGICSECAARALA